MILQIISEPFDIFLFRFHHLTAGVSLACFIEIQWLKNWAAKFPCMVHMVQRFSRMIIVAVNYDETLSLLLMIKLLIIKTDYDSGVI